MGHRPLPGRYRPARHFATPLAASATLLATAALAGQHAVGRREERLFRSVNDAPDRACLPAWIVMQSGSLGAAFVTGGVLARLGRPRQAAVATAFGAGVWVGAKAVKRVVRRGRPDAYLDRVTVRGGLQNGCGYPSGHAAVATTLAMIVSWRRSPPAAAGAAAVAATTGAARVYVGAHLPLDVTGGYALGALAGHVARRCLTHLGTG